MLEIEPYQSIQKLFHVPYPKLSPLLSSQIIHYSDTFRKHLFCFFILLLPKCAFRHCSLFLLIKDNLTSLLFLLIDRFPNDPFLSLPYTIF